MKKLFITVVLLFQFALGQCIDIGTIKTVAKNFMDKKRPYSKNITDNILLESQDGEIAFYVVNFTEGGWIIVSGTMETVPVLGYSLVGQYKIEDKKPEAFSSLLNSYKQQIFEIKRKPSQNRMKDSWDDLIYRSPHLKSYSPGTNLLNTSRGIVKWNQEENNSGGCTPSYNSYCPTASCDCGHKPVGCGPVAMGQVMWYWTWPIKSSFRIYNWNLMPNELTNSSSASEGDEIARFLDDCGDAANKSYIGCNTWTTISNINSALNNDFYFKGTDVVVRSAWPGDPWLDLLRAEIDNERPVIYRGDKSDLSGEKHIFVLAGYDSNDPDYFLFNFGWGGSYYQSYQYLNDLTPGSSEFNANQMAIVGISPSYSEVDENINDFSYTTLSSTKYEFAKNSISVPTNNSSLVINAGGNLTICAGTSVTLKGGFKASAGSNLKVSTYPVNGSNDCGIYVEGWTNGFIDGVLRYRPHNANTYQFEAYALNGALVFQSAGSVNGIPVAVWDGTGSTTGYYACRITFRNNCGEKISNSYNVFSPGH